MLRTLLAALAGLLALNPAASAAAMQQDASEALRARAEALVALVNGQGDPSEMFTAEFLAQVPPAQLRTINESLRAQYGAARRIERLEVRSPTAATVHIDAERAIITMDMAIQAEAPHRIQGLLITGARVRDDSLAAVAREIAELPGDTSFALARLGEGEPELLAGHQPQRSLAIGSTFKLWILAEISRQIQAGELRWDDVATLDRRTLPSGMLQDWPQGAPLTIHTLAALMISISDNTATDLLLEKAGRENVERMIAAIGVEDAARNRPFLSTLEAFALKAAPAEAFAAWQAADEAGRRRLLGSDYAMSDPGQLDPTRFAGAPRRLDVEWFASAADLVRTMDWLRRHGDDTARAILAISSGIQGDAARDLAYIGYKGGSEPGVLNLTWLVRSRSGSWYALTGTWNDPEANLQEARLAELMRRALQLVPE